MEKFQVFRIEGTYPGIPGLPKRSLVTMADICRSLPLVICKENEDEGCFCCNLIGVYKYNYLVAVKSRNDLSRVESAADNVHYALFEINNKHLLVLLSSRKIYGCLDDRIFRVQLAQKIENPLIYQTYFEKIPDKTWVLVRRNVIACDLL